MGVHLRKSYHGQGLAQEAARAVIKFAFETLQIRACSQDTTRRMPRRNVLSKGLGFLLRTKSSMHLQAQITCPIC
ncbi:hypothetical protein HDF10_002788 [Edaphobacter lichenicola]|uniref:N-acetyltransferase domain-containing protein n=2 Tax=Tunturiibacter TaxID=3154218 RepID=A0A7W8JBA9_9BACT|nr:hypothetical protein [Edaphobacter lichenicola]